MEIVIENPVESQPSPPQSSSSPSSPWNVTVPPASLSSSVVASTSAPAATAMMTITIAENSTTSSTYPPPVRFSYRESCATNSLSFAGDPYAARRGEPRGRSYGDPDGASPLLRRTDKSGLLGIAEPEASGSRNALRSPRFLGGIASPAAAGILPRRVECVGQLDPVLEIPGQPTRANVPPAVASNAFPTGSSVPLLVPMILGQDARGDVRLDACEALSTVNSGRSMKSTSFDSLEPRHRNVDVGSTLATFDPNGSESSSVDNAGYSASFGSQETREGSRTVGRLSRLARNEHNEGIDVPVRYSEARGNFLCAVRGGTFPGFEGNPQGNVQSACNLPTTRTTTSTVTTSTTTVASTTRKQESTEGASDDAPEEERAEAEGCEHGSSRNPSKNGESAQAADEFADSDGIQTLRVIILSEQL